MRDFQASSRRQGAQFERTVETLLLINGWKVKARHWIQRDVDVEIDIVAIDPYGQEWWIECKGSWESESGRNGLRRTDTTKKLLGSAAILRLLPEDQRRPYMVVTSHLPLDGAAANWLRQAEGVYFDRLWVTDMGDGKCCAGTEPHCPGDQDHHTTTPKPAAAAGPRKKRRPVPQMLF